MARTNSNMVPLGSEAKGFYLYDTVSESKVSFKKIKGSVGTIILFICNHCPYVVHINPSMGASAIKSEIQDTFFSS